MTQDTIRFKGIDADKEEIDNTLKHVYEAMLEKGYNPVVQLCGYFYSREPVYITSHNGARADLSKIDFYKVLERVVEVYLNKINNSTEEH